MRVIMWIILTYSTAAYIGPEPFENDEPLEEHETVEMSELEQMKLVTPQCTRAGQELGPSGHYSVPDANNGSSSCWMDRGNVSSGVWSLQRALVFCWQQNISIDSEYGPQTQQAVRNVQTRLGIQGGSGPEPASANA